MSLVAAPQRTIESSTTRTASVDFGLATPSSADIWLNPDGSLYRLHTSDEPIGELEALLMDINHVRPNQPFTQVDPAIALARLLPTVDHSANDPSQQPLLEWIVRGSHSCIT